MKDLKTLYENLKIIEKSRIGTVKVIPEEGKTRIKGMDDDHHVFLDDTISEIGIDRKMVITNISQFIAKLELFDLDRVNVKAEGGSDYYSGFEFKQGRQKVVASMGSKSSFREFNLPEDKVNFTHCIQKNEFDKITRAISAISKGGRVSLINFSCADGQVLLNIMDDTVSDFYQDVLVDLEEDSPRWSHQWNKDRFVSLAKEEIKNNDDEQCCIDVTEHGIMFMRVRGLTFALSPMTH